MLRPGQWGTYLRGVSGEVWAGATGLAGWLLLTWGVQEIVGRLWVWKVSMGLLLLGLFGFGTMWQLFRAGLLGLTDDQGATDEGTASDGST